MLGDVLPDRDAGRAGRDPSVEHSGAARGQLLHTERDHRDEGTALGAHDRPAR